MSIEVVHKHIILRIEATKPPTELELKDWMIELVDKVGMKILAGPIHANIDYMPGNNSSNMAIFSNMAILSSPTARPPIPIPQVL